VLDRKQQRQQRRSVRDVTDVDIFVQRMSSVAANTEPVKNRNAERGRKISIRGSADLRFVDGVTETFGCGSCIRKELRNSIGSFHRRTVYSAVDLNGNSFIKRLD